MSLWTGPFLARTTWLLAAAVASACLLCCAPAQAASWWQPPQQLTWYWQLTGTPLVEPVDATDIDGFDAAASTVAGLHARGQHVICYIDVGTAENWRSDYGQFPTADLGSSNGWPGEQWLNVADSAIQPIMAARFQMCRQKGFDAVEPDNMDGYENSTGFSISASQQAAYDEWVAQDVHSLGMAVLQKNDPEQAAQLQPYFDGALDEQCNEYSECSSFAPYVSAGKPVLDAEYQSSLDPGFCSADAAAHIMGALYALALDGSIYKPCFGPSTTSGASPGSGAPGSSRPARPKPVPRVAIGRGPLKVVNGRIRVLLACPAGETFCAGELRIQALIGRGGRRPSLALGAARFHVRGAQKRIVAVKLRPAARRRLGPRRSVPVRLSVLAHDRARRSARSSRVDVLQIVRAR
jgi:hypothetical protein